MTIVNNHITIYRGDTKTYTLYFYDGADRLDLTDYTIRFTVKTNKSDTDDNAVIRVEGTIVTAVSGIATISLTTTNTDDLTPSDLYYDIQISKEADEEEETVAEVHTVRAGIFTVLTDITITSLEEEE